MTRVRKAELEAVTAVLEDGQWETPEQAAEAAIKALDAVRNGDTRFYHVAIVEFPLGHTDAGKAWYLGVGPFPGARSAQNSLKKVLGSVGNLARGGVVIPVTTPAGFDEHLKEVG